MYNKHVKKALQQADCHWEASVVVLTQWAPFSAQALLVAGVFRFAAELSCSLEYDTDDTDVKTDSRVQKCPDLQKPSRPQFGDALLAKFGASLSLPCSSPLARSVAVARLHLWHDDGGSGLRDKAVDAALLLLLAVREEGEEGADGAEEQDHSGGDGAIESDAVGDGPASVEDLVARRQEDGEIEGESDESEEL